MPKIMPKPIPSPISSSANRKRTNASSSNSISLPDHFESLGLADDSFIVEAPSFVVPYLIEKSASKTVQSMVPPSGICSRRSSSSQKRKVQQRKVHKGTKITDASLSVNALTKGLEAACTKNDPYRLPWRTCDRCSFQSESSLMMAYHWSLPLALGSAKTGSAIAPVPTLPV
uniref:Uncharacterized protein n=1 Tax=Daphnia galeata TaxID=27404 RepID=A0A8J2WFE2_9CRUS|nr:unnamed protein product [Daphnia galeata]